MLEGILLPLAIIGGIIVATIVIAFSLYKIVPANYADVVVQSGRTRVFSSDTKYSGEGDFSSGGKAAYFKMPRFIPGVGMRVHSMPLEVLSINVPDFKAFDIDRARFLCDIMAYVVIANPVMAAKRFNGDMRELSAQVSKVVQANTRDSTTKKTVREIINDREGIISEIREPLAEAITQWGLALTNFELVEFKDTADSHVIGDISSIIEEQINSEATQKNAEQKKLARVKVAITDEAARKREIERDEEVSKREQKRDKLVAEIKKEAVDKQLEVTRVEKVKNQKIEKERAEVKAEQDKVVARIQAEQEKAVEEINKEQKLLEGQGDRLRAEEQAIGEAAPIRETGNAEADVIRLKLEAEAKGKDELQKALNRFGDAAIRALVAEKVVEMQKEVGIAGAKALEFADLKVFAGNGNSKNGFDMGQLIESIRTGSDSTAKAVLNNIARPTDLGFKELTGIIAGEVLDSKEQKRPKRHTIEKTKPKATHKPVVGSIKELQKNVRM